MARIEKHLLGQTKLPGAHGHVGVTGSSGSGGSGNDPEDQDEVPVSHEIENDISIRKDLRDSQLE